jgi:5'-phosphate synthase pdxT subunit
VIVIGVLALQGDFGAHAQVLGRLGAEVLEVRRTADLDRVDGLVLPGGESTTLLNLMQDEPWFDALRAFHAQGGAFLGTCAGAILLAREVRQPAQPSLGLLDAVVERNAFGRQIDSFETTLPAPALGGALPGVFIRAPRFRSLGPRVSVLASLGEEPVLVQEGRVIAGTFHPELTGEGRLHRHFVEIAHAARPQPRAAAGR